MARVPHSRLGQLSVLGFGSLKKLVHIDADQMAISIPSRMNYGNERFGELTSVIYLVSMFMIFPGC
jgi:hypothetical protein